jgi:hypothetical protein
MNTATIRIEAMVDDYKLSHQELLAENPDFREWLEREYKPIAGGWQY